MLASITRVMTAFTDETIVQQAFKEPYVQVDAVMDQYMIQQISIDSATGEAVWSITVTLDNPS